VVSTVSKDGAALIFYTKWALPRWFCIRTTNHFHTHYLHRCHTEFSAFSSPRRPFSLIFSFFRYHTHGVLVFSSSSLRSGDFSHMIKVITVHGSTNSSKKKISTYRATFDGFLAGSAMWAGGFCNLGCSRIFWGLTWANIFFGSRRAGKDLFCRFGVARNLNLQAGSSGVYGNEELVLKVFWGFFYCFWFSCIPHFLSACIMKGW